MMVVLHFRYPATRVSVSGGPSELYGVFHIPSPPTHPPRPGCGDGGGLSRLPPRRLCCGMTPDTRAENSKV